LNQPLGRRSRKSFSTKLAGSWPSLRMQKPFSPF